jgi:hypothetical protein
MKNREGRAEIYAAYSKGQSYDWHTLQTHQSVL